MNNYRTPRGFTLIELSIVLVIIGLIVGSIFVGSSLIRQAQLHSVISNISQYRVAFLAFRDKFTYWPGDLPNAQSYWPAPICIDDPIDTSNTCNGNGNEVLDGVYSDECLRSLQHLSLAKMVKETHSGIVVSPSVPHKAGYNTVKTDLPGTGLIIRDNQDGSPVYGRRGLYLQVASLLPTSSVYAGKALTPDEAWNIDQKLDDGKAMTGYLFSRTGNPPGSTNCLSGAEYNLAARTVECMLNYWIYY